MNKENSLEIAKLYFQSGGKSFYNPFTLRTELPPNARQPTKEEVEKEIKSIASQQPTFKSPGVGTQTSIPASTPSLPEKIVLSPQDIEKLDTLSKVYPQTSSTSSPVKIDITTPVHASNTTYIDTKQQKREESVEQVIQQRAQQVLQQLENLSKKSEELSQRYVTTRTEREREEIRKQIEEINRRQEELILQYYGLKHAEEKIKEIESDPYKNIFAHVYTGLSGKGAEYFMSLFFGNPQKVVREKIIEEMTRRVKEQDFEPNILGALKTVGKTELEFFTQNPLGLAVTGYVSGYGLTAAAKVPQVSSFLSKASDIISKVPGAVNVGKFVAEHPYLTFGAIETAKTGYQVYSFLSTPKEQIIINKNEALQNFEKQVEELKQSLIGQGYVIKEEGGKIIGTKDVLVHTEDLAKLYAEQSEAIKQSIQEYLSKGYRIVEQSPEKIVLEGETNVVTIKTKDTYEDLNKAILEYKKELEKQGYKIEEKEGKLYVYGEEKIVYDVASKRAELENQISNLINEYKKQGYKVKEENGKIIIEKPFNFEEIIQKIGADILKDVSAFIGFKKGIEKGIKDFFTIKEEKYVLAKASKDVTSEELYETIKNIKKPEELQKMYGPKEKLDHSLIIEKESEGIVGQKGIRLYQEGYGSKIEIAKSLQKGAEGILERKALIHFERPFGYQTIISKEEFQNILKEGKVVWKEGPYKIIEYQGTKYFVSDIPPKNVIEVNEDFVKAITLGKTERTFYKADYLIQRGEDYLKVDVIMELPTKYKEIYIPIKEEESVVKGFRGEPYGKNLLKDLAEYYAKLLEKEKLENVKEVVKSMQAKSETTKIAIGEGNVYVGIPETKLEVKPIVGIKEEVEYMINRELFEKLREGFAGIKLVNVISPKPITTSVILPPRPIQTTKTEVTSIIDKDLKPKGFEKLTKLNIDISTIKPKIDITEKQIITLRKNQETTPQQTQTQTTTDLTTQKTLTPTSTEIEKLKKLKIDFSLPLRFKLPEFPKNSVDKFVFGEFKTSKQPLAYEPSLIGLAFGIKTKNIGKMFTGFEIRGIPLKSKTK